VAKAAPQANSETSTARLESAHREVIG